MPKAKPLDYGVVDTFVSVITKGSPCIADETGTVRQVWGDQGTRAGSIRRGGNR